MPILQSLNGGRPRVLEVLRGLLPYLPYLLWLLRPPPDGRPAFVQPIGRGAMRGEMGNCRKAKWQPLRGLAAVWSG